MNIFKSLMAALLLLVSSLLEVVTASYPPMSYGSHSHTPTAYSNPNFLPAGYGKMPDCAKDPRLTFCEETENYPKDRILYLIDNKMYDTDTFLRDETRDTYTFEAREAPTIMTMYQKPKPKPSKGYSMPPLSQTQRNSSTNFGYRRPSKYGSSNNLKPIPPSSARGFYPMNTTPSLNSFTSTYHNKYEPPPIRSTYWAPQRSSFPFQDNEGGPYPRYPKNNRFRNSVPHPYQPPRENQNWWKKILRRDKRQAQVANALCPSRSSYIMPMVAQSVQGEWMYLVNVDDRYKQLVKSETCIQNSCEGGCDVPDGFSAFCQQQYVQKRLVALDGSGTKLNSDTFWFPSCCLCKLRANGG